MVVNWEILWPQVAYTCYSIFARMKLSLKPHSYHFLFFVIKPNLCCIQGFYPNWVYNIKECNVEATNIQQLQFNLCRGLSLSSTLASNQSCSCLCLGIWHSPCTEALLLHNGEPDKAFECAYIDRLLLFNIPHAMPTCFIKYLQTINLLFFISFEAGVTSSQA